MHNTDILIYEDLEEQDKTKKNKKKNALFFYFKDKLYNLNNTVYTNSPYFDCMIKKDGEIGYVLIKYNTDDTINVGEQS